MYLVRRGQGAEVIAMTQPGRFYQCSECGGVHDSYEETDWCPGPPPAASTRRLRVIAWTCLALGTLAWVVAGIAALVSLH